MLRSITKQTQPAQWFNVNCAFDDEIADMLLDHFPAEYKVKYNGNRDCTNNFRKFITRKTTPELAEVFAEWNTQAAREYFSTISGTDCTETKLRIELCQDGPGFYLDQHIDINEKLFTMLIYLGDGNQNWGTSIYNDDHSYFGSTKFAHNTGWMTTTDSQLWHGVPNSVNIDDRLRHSIMINYVNGDWKDIHQLY
jgi:hypothetical protein